MSSEINTMSDLHRAILRLLMAGWQTMDQAKSAGNVSLNDLAAHFGLPPEELRRELALLEALGYVDNVHSMGRDQTMSYQGIEQESVRSLDPDNPTYFISENGKRLVIADTTQAGDEATSPA